jgi:peroxiredoxin
MTIQSGDPIPNATFTVMAPDGPQLRTTDQIFKSRKVVLFGVAGLLHRCATNTICRVFSTTSINSRRKGWMRSR